MAKLYKIEYEDWGWEQVIRLLDGYIDSITTQIERAKKDPEMKESILFESFINASEMVKNQALRYKDDIKRQLKEQSYEAQKHLT